MIDVAELHPFGAIASARDPGTPLAALADTDLLALLRRHRLVALRGFAPPAGDALPSFARRLGELQAWSFGEVNELRAAADAANYLYTTAAVPFHWDGAFAGRVPSWIVFHCALAPAADAGGETLFSDAVGIVADAGDARTVWDAVRITYRTERVAHYGGAFTAPLIGRHPRTGEAALRYAEPVHDRNPVSLEITGMDPASHAALIADLAGRLRDPRRCLAWSWRRDDVLVADNHALLHGRNAYRDAAARHLRRVNVL